MDLCAKEANFCKYSNIGGAAALPAPLGGMLIDISYGKRVAKDANAPDPQKSQIFSTLFTFDQQINPVHFLS